MMQAMTKSVSIDGYTLNTDSDEPLVLDVDIAARAGLAQPRDVRFRGLDAFLEGAVAAARKSGHATTILGRWRPIPQIESRNPAERAFGVACDLEVRGAAEVDPR